MELHVRGPRTLFKTLWIDFEVRILRLIRRFDIYLLFLRLLFLCPDLANFRWNWLR